MAVPVLADPVADHGLSVRALSRRFDPAPARGAAPTLDAAITGLWARISAHRVALCPLCQDEMEPEYGAGALPVAGRCRGCGTSLT